MTTHTMGSEMMIPKYPITGVRKKSDQKNTIFLFVLRNNADNNCKID